MRDLVSLTDAALLFAALTLWCLIAIELFA